MTLNRGDADVQELGNFAQFPFEAADQNNGNPLAFR
jgi:hypothetical protein